ncbi:KUP/HAK/KT family potassium transporter [Paraburkholderia sp. GAS348]|uniref:KUP/HAK/KT family potassium transporter n=1 Tax=Paraburkholderia sp. GAS348 TaxID=3035132 RepID=UPI003D193980
MLTTTIQMIALSPTLWHWSTLAVAAASVPLLIVDGMLIAANLRKIPRGGWFPVTVGNAFIHFAYMPEPPPTPRTIRGVTLRARPGLPQ